MWHEGVSSTLRFPQRIDGERITRLHAGRAPAGSWPPVPRSAIECGRLCANLLSLLGHPNSTRQPVVLSLESAVQPGAQPMRLTCCLQAAEDYRLCWRSVATGSIKSEGLHCNASHRADNVCRLNRSGRFATSR